MPRRLTSLRYAMHPAAEASGDWLAEVRWHRAEDFWTEGGFLLFQVPAGVANGLRRGRRYAIALADSQQSGIIQGELFWPEHPERWTSEASPPVPAPAIAPGGEASKGGPRRSPWRWVVLSIGLMALAGTALWLTLPRLVPPTPRAPAVARPEPNRPPIAPTIAIETVAGKALVVDIHAHARDPDGDIPRLLEVEPAQHGGVEQLDQHRFRYRAPVGRPQTDVFLYRIADTSGATGEGWVFVSVAPGPRGRSPAEERDAGAPASPRVGRAQVAPRDGPVAAEPAGDASGAPAEPVSRPPRATSKSGEPASVPAPSRARSRQLRTRIADALDAEDLQRVRFLCAEAMMVNASLAKFCGIVFDPNKRLFESHPDATFSIACYDQAARLGDTEAGALAAAVRAVAPESP